jgi:Fur family peroxide stress response transcriptional regulator
MPVTISQIKEKLVEKGLKVTPQRIAILEAIYTQNNHPTADMIMDYIKDTHPSIASGTVYKVLDILIEKGLIIRVKTEKDIMRYDGILVNHHHLYCSESEEIKDYINEDLDQLLSDYFKNNGIENFQVEGIRLQINGKFIKSGNQRKKSKSNKYGKQ